MKIIAKGNYDLSCYKMQTPGANGSWDALEFNLEGNKCDILIVFNKPLTDINVTCRKGGRWLVIQEPPYQKNEYFRDYFKYFDLVISGFKMDGEFIHMNRPALLPWHIGMDYTELSKISVEKLTQKKDEVIWVTSTSNMNPGHEPRLNFLKALTESSLPFKAYGRGLIPISRKFDVIFPSKYGFAIENYSGEDYWTEKIGDVLLAWSMPFYYGCINMDKYFPKGSYLTIDINNPAKSIDMVKEAIKNNLWKENLEAIGEARDLVLNKYNFFPIVKNELAAYCQSKYIRTYIPANPAKLVSKIKNLFINK
jgi:hypothetical protein